MKLWNQDAESQIYIPPIVELIAIGTSSALPANPFVTWVAPMIDARLRVKTSLCFIMAAGSALEVDLTGFGTLWLYESDDDQSGVWGRRIPLNNLATSTEAAPLAIPAAKPLMGWSREFQTSADYVEGKFTLSSNVTLGSWYLQARYQPAPGQRFTPSEWDAIKAAAKPFLVGPVLKI